MHGLYCPEVFVCHVAVIMNPGLARIYLEFLRLCEECGFRLNLLMVFVCHATCPLGDFELHDGFNPVIFSTLTGTKDSFCLQAGGFGGVLGISMF